MSDRFKRIVSWHDAANAARYHVHAAEHRMYADTSRHLVELSALEPDELVMDLACGTGATTRAILDRMGSSVHVIAVDMSTVQLAWARRSIDAGNVRFVHAPAECVGDVLVKENVTSEPVDAVLCNSAFWQLSLRETLRQLKSVGRSGTRLVFNMPPRIFPTLSSDPPPEDEQSFKEAMDFYSLMRDVARREFSYVPPEPEPRDFEAYESDFLAAFDECGFSVVNTEQSVTENTPEEMLDWYRIPIFRENVLPGLDPEKSGEVLEAAAAAWRPTCASFPSHWIDFVTEIVDDGG